MSTQILWYDEQENQKGVLTYESAIHEEDLDGADKLTVVTRRNAAKRDRLVWQDNAGYWHEHIVDEISTTHKGGAKRHTLTCSNSISELFRVEAPGTKAKKRVSEHLADICAGTRWNAGNSSSTVVEIETWHKSVRECMTELCAQCGGELVTNITVDDNGIVSRTVRVVVDYGTNTVKRTFTYGHNMGAVKREVAADEVYTAVRGYGAKTAETAWQAHIDELEEQYDASTDADERKQLQKRINAAREKLKAVQDNDYAERLMVEVKKGDSKRNRWGVFNGLAMVHSWYIYTDNNCTSRQFLRRQCNALLKTLCNPLVRYEFDTAEVDADMWQDVRLGSKVLCIDPVFDGGAAIERVSHIRRNLSGTMRCRIAIGKRANPQIDQYKTTQRLSKITTGNGVKTQSYTPTSSGGNYSGVSGYSPIGQYEVDGETYTIGDGNQPAAIQVVTPPTKTEYYIGEIIDYNDIEVQLLNGEGETYTSEAYPDGMIPFDELEFPIDIAPSPDDGKTYGTYLGEPLEVRFRDGRIIVNSPFYCYEAKTVYKPSGGDTSHNYWGGDGFNLGVTDSGGIVEMLVTSEEEAGETVRLAVLPDGKVVFASDYPMSSLKVMWFYPDGQRNSYGYSRDGISNLIWDSVYDENGNLSCYMWTYSTIQNPSIKTSAQVDGIFNKHYGIAHYMWTGEFLISGKAAIPVDWDNLTASFEIDVHENEIEYSTTAFKSTGGGRF